MYEIGKVYIWQNQVGPLAHLNDTECTVLDHPHEVWCVIKQLHAWGQRTDSPCDNGDNYYFAEVGDLRPKKPPRGERSIMALFRAPELVPA